MLWTITKEKGDLRFLLRKMEVVGDQEESGTDMVSFQQHQGFLLCVMLIIAASHHHRIAR
jgi:hypothetical protein